MLKFHMDQSFVWVILAVAGIWLAWEIPRRMRNNRGIFPSELLITLVTYAGTIVFATLLHEAHALSPAEYRALIILLFGVAIVFLTIFYVFRSPGPDGKSRLEKLTDSQLDVRTNRITTTAIFSLMSQFGSLSFFACLLLVIALTAQGYSGYGGTAWLRGPFPPLSNSIVDTLAICHVIGGANIPEITNPILRIAATLAGVLGFLFQAIVIYAVLEFYDVVFKRNVAR